jgi:hypothetical protein
MWKLYKYLFFKLYRLAVKMNMDTTPEYTAFVSVVALVFMNILSIDGILKLAGMRPGFLDGLSTPTVVVLIISLGVPQYFLLVHNRKYEKIAKEFDNESLTRARTGAALVLFYVILSLFSIFFFGAQAHV